MKRELTPGARNRFNVLTPSISKTVGPAAPAFFPIVTGRQLLDPKDRFTRASDTGRPDW